MNPQEPAVSRYDAQCDQDAVPRNAGCPYAGKTGAPTQPFLSCRVIARQLKNGFDVTDPRTDPPRHPPGAR